jgi:hypothetical protein
MLRVQVHRRDNKQWALAYFALNTSPSQFETKRSVSFGDGGAEEQRSCIFCDW